MIFGKDDVKKWLKETGRDRYWLAEQCGVDKSTVDKWLSTGREIPSKALIVIQGLYSKQQSSPKTHYQTYNDVVSIPVLMSNEEYKLIAKAAKLSGQTVEEFIRQASLEDLDASQSEQSGPNFETVEVPPEEQIPKPETPQERRYYNEIAAQQGKDEANKKWAAIQEQRRNRQTDKGAGNNVG